MNDVVSSQESADHAADDGPPEFGLIDMIEAFTAMRHEWRGQAKASHAVAEAVQAAASSLQQLEAKLLAQVANRSADESRELAGVIAETDHLLTQAVAVTSRCETHRRQQEEAEAKAIQDHFNGMNAMARWFARPLLTFVTAQRKAREPMSEDAAVEGLNLVLVQLRHLMKERQIERVDALGQPFDGETMNAIGTVAGEPCPSGHVAEQLSPSYQWRGSILRFADVRVAS